MNARSSSAVTASIRIQNILSLKGYSTYKLIKDEYFSSGTIQKLRNNEVLGKQGLETLCTLLQCDISDILEFVPDTPTE